MFKAPCGKELLQSYAGQYVHGTVVHHSTGGPVYVFTTFSAFKGYSRLTVSYVLFFSLPLASDATFIFEETKHSVEAREMMQTFFVGIFVEVSDVLSCCVTKFLTSSLLQG